MADKWSLKQVFLRTFIATVLASATIGIYVFVLGDFGETEVRTGARDRSIGSS